MKHLSFVVAFMLSLLFASGKTVNERILEAFHKLYPNEKNVVWYEGSDYTEAYLDKKEEKCRIRFDEWGHVISVRRDYTGDYLCPFLKARLLGKYKSTEVMGVTEWSSDEGLTYYVVLEDNRYIYHVQANAAGQMILTEKLISANREK
jgi:hypothetical protein